MSLVFRGRFELDRVTAATREGAVAGVQMGVEHLLQESRRLVPNEEGTLERSGRAGVDPATLTGAVSYDTEYAVPQHERLDYRHSDGRTAKYLERPWTAGQQVVAQLVAAQVRRSLR